jgi:hypothetical protein
MHKNTPAHYMRFLKHEHESADRYEVYLAHSAQPKNRLINEQNLFDDVNSKDRKMLKTARMYLARNKQSSTPTP